jgi:hypothetical protein
MSAPKKLTLKQITDHCGLAIEYVDDIPSTVPGYLDESRSPRFIAINHSLSPNEQLFTIAHEIGHFVLHHGKARRYYHSFILDRHPNNPFLDRFLAILRRYARIHYNRDWEADGYAILLLVGLGETEALATYLEHHPENKWWAVAASLWWNYRFLCSLPIYRALTR